MKHYGKILTVIILVLAIGIPAIANVQLPVDEVTVDDVYYAVGENAVTGETLLNPTMIISWEDPNNWADDDEVHEPDYYEIIVTNLTLDDEETIQVDAGSDEYESKSLEIHNEMNLDTGSLYRISVQPYHYHNTTTDGVTTSVLATNTSYPETVYAVSDLDVEFIADEDSIQVIWDDYGDESLEYRIVYAIGDYTSSTKTELVENKEGEILGLTMDSDDVTSFYDEDTNRNKLSYTLDTNIYPGQVYSIMVEPTNQYYEGYLLYRNRNYPYIRSASTNVVLDLSVEGDYLRLSWEVPASFQVGQDQNEYSLTEATLIEYQDGNSRNLVIFDGDAATVGYYRIVAPIWETEYQIQLVYSAVDDTSKPEITPVSNIVTYVPSDYYIEPTKPYVPDFLSEDMLSAYESTMDLEDVYDYLADNHFVPGYTYNGDLDDLFEEQVTFSVDEETDTFNLVWGAFQRLDVDETSATYGENIYDTNVYYDIWVADELDTLIYATKYAEDLRFSATSGNNVILDASEQIVGYRYDIDSYYDTEDSEYKDITPDDVYYIKIVAKKVNANATLTSVATIVSVYYTYDGDSFEPPTVSKPPLQEKAEDTDTTGVTMNWLETWTEVISTDAADTGVLSTWTTEVWVDDSGNLYDVETDDTEYFDLYMGEDVVEDFEDYMSNLGQAVSLTTRTIDLGTDAFGASDVLYYFTYVPYQTVLNGIENGQLADETYDFTDYFTDWIAADEEGTSPIDWEKITPHLDEDDNTFMAYRQESLLPNTSYMFVLYPYRKLQNGDLAYAHYPTPLIVTTLPEEVIVTPDPTVPSLFTTDITEGEITLTWKYNTDFGYEVVYSMEDDIDTAESLGFEIPEDVTDDLYPTDGAYYEFMVDDLFPLTTYYFWIKAVQSADGAESAWSNPASGTTLDIDAPNPPRGLGVASKETRETYDYDLSVSEDHIMLEWIKDPLDGTDEDSEAKVTTSISYIVEVANNPKFIDPLYVVSSGGSADIIPDTTELLDKNVLLVTDLVGNRFYYARAKTILTVTGSEAGQVISKESESYTAPIKIITLASGDEYDGYVDPALTILPTDDYELIYDETGQSLEFRFRTDEEDSDGNMDNQVDQRLITSLIEDNLHEYVIDLQSYSDQDVLTRRIIIPHTVMEAFAGYSVDLRIEADDINVTIPAEGVIAFVEDQVADYGIAPNLIIDLERLEETDITETIPVSGLTSVSVPQEMAITVKSTRRTESVNYTDEQMSLEMKTNSRYQVYQQESAVYVKDSQAKWQKVDSSYDRYEAVMKFDTAKVGTYGVVIYDRETEVTGNTKPNHWSESYREQVYENYSVEGLVTYSPDAAATRVAFLQGIYGTLMDADAIDLTDSLSSQERQTLVRAGVVSTDLTSGGISRAEAIAAFGRATEIYQGTQVSLSDSDIAEARVAGYSGDLGENIAKAKALGLISSVNNLRPNEALSYGEFFTLWARMID